MLDRVESEVFRCAVRLVEAEREFAAAGPQEVANAHYALQAERARLMRTVDGLPRHLVIDLIRANPSMTLGGV